MNKEAIEKAVRALRDSAASRGTQQGVLIYSKILEMLDSTQEEDQVSEIKCKLNQALLGIEAHGYLTEQEFKIVRELRK